MLIVYVYDQKIYLEPNNQVHQLPIQPYHSDYLNDLVKDEDYLVLIDQIIIFIQHIKPHFPKYYELEDPQVINLPYYQEIRQFIQMPVRKVNVFAQRIPRANVAIQQPDRPNYSVNPMLIRQPRINYENHQLIFYYHQYLLVHNFQHDFLLFYNHNYHLMEVINRVLRYSDLFVTSGWINGLMESIKLYFESTPLRLGQNCLVEYLRMRDQNLSVLRYFIRFPPHYLSQIDYYRHRWVEGSSVGFSFPESSVGLH